MPPALLDEPPVPLGLELELDAESDGEVGDEDDEEDEPPGTTTVSFFSVVLLEDDEPGEVVVDPPGTTVVVSFFSHAASAKAPTSTNRYPLRFISTLLSSVIHSQKCTAGLAIGVPAQGTLMLRDAPWRSPEPRSLPARSAARGRRGSSTTSRGRDDRPSPRT